MKLIGMLLAGALFGAFNGFIESVAVSKLWRWFLADEYGSGPSFASWYGIIMIASVMFGIHTFHLQSEKSDGSFIMKMMVRSFAIVFICVGVLAVAYGISSLAGWRV